MRSFQAAFFIMMGTPMAASQLFTYSIQEQVEGKNKFHYTFQRTSPSSGQSKSLTFTDFKALGGEYKNNPLCVKAFDDLLNKIKNRMGAEQLTKGTSYRFEAIIEKDSKKPLCFTLEKKGFIASNIAALGSNPGTHFDPYFENNEDASALLITSPKKNVLLVPALKVETLGEFAKAANSVEKKHFWCLFFAFLEKHGTQIESISVNTRKASENTFPHLHLRFNPKKKLRDMLMPKMALGMCTEKGEIRLPKEITNVIPSIPAHDMQEEISAADGNIQEERSSYVNTPAALVLLFPVAAGAAGWVYKKAQSTKPAPRTHPSTQEDVEDI